MNSHRFTVGSNHENEKGSFKVLAIKGESMLIEWDSGERITTPIALQERILTWARNTMVNDDGRMKKSKSGIWEISENGRKWLLSHLNEKP